MVTTVRGVEDDSCDNLELADPGEHDCYHNNHVPVAYLIISMAILE